MIDPVLLRAMKAAGVSDAQVVAIIAAYSEAKIDDKREATRQRVAAHRARMKSSENNDRVTDVTVTGVTSVTCVTGAENAGDIYTARAPALFPVGISNDIPPNNSPCNPPKARSKSNGEIVEAFARFWNVWPNKVGKPAAERAFSKCWREIDAIIAGVEQYARHKPPDRQWLNPATFLNQRRWEDAPALPLAPARSPQQSRGLAARMLNEIYRKERENGQGQGSAQIVELLPFDRRDVG